MTNDEAGDGRFSADQLREYATAALVALGTPEPIATQVARSLVLSNVVGHDSHGIVRLLQYSGWIRDGQIRPSAVARVIGAHGATALVAGGWGFGQPAVLLAADLVGDLARRHGVAAVGVRECNHVGRLGEYVGRLSEAGLMGLAFCNSGAVVAPFGGTGRALGTNPFAWSAPGGPDGTIVVDFSTAGVAEGKLRISAAEGRPVPLGLITDRYGQPTTDPADFFAGGALLPFGGHKGSGMSVLIEVLGGLLTGMGTAPTPGYAGGNGTVLIALNVAAFTERVAYEAGAAEFCDLLAAAGSGPTGGTVLLPGQIEVRTRTQRERDGIPLTPGVLSQIQQLTDDLGLPRLAGHPAVGR